MYVLVLCVLAFTLAVPGYFFFRQGLVAEGESDVEAARAWLTALAGPLAITAALIAAIPVFEQLDELKLGTVAAKIAIVRSTLETVDREQKEVSDYYQFLSQLKSPRDIETKCEDPKWDALANSIKGYRGTPDKALELAHNRLELASSIEGFLLLKKRFCLKAVDYDDPEGKRELKSARERLAAAKADYDNGVEFYRQVHVAQMKRWESELSIADTKEIVDDLCRDHDNPLRGSKYCER